MKCRLEFTRARSTHRRSLLSICGMAVMLSGCGGLPPPIGSAGHTVGAPQNNRAAYKIIYRFNPLSGGAFAPEASLISLGGRLYGTTTEGGVYCNCGTVFEVDTSGNEKVLHSFGDYPNDGVSPDYGLVAVKNGVYGTTPSGGNGQCEISSISVGCGTIFKVSKSGHEDVLYNFQGSTDGSDPEGGLTALNGVLYGTTTWGGASSCYCGTVFSVSLLGTERVLYSFKAGKDGSRPAGNLLPVNSRLYGMTYDGGGRSCKQSYGCGVVFSITTGGREHVLYRFKGGSDGSTPYSNGLIWLNGTFYGTTWLGGSSVCQCGTVFELNATGKEHVLYRFKGGSDGAYPAGSLVNVNGTLYGVSAGGGDAGCQGGGGCGTIFAVTTAGKERVLHRFGHGQDGANPEAGLMLLNGTLYGTTIGGGGSQAYGTVFALTP